ncbi:MAG: hypothetical protein Q3971_02305 [Moraxella sp.]|nr:hypothetical protein [Moraxella sp.]
MCCKIDLSSQKDARHFLGKDEPALLPKTADNVANITYCQQPAMSVWDKIVAHFNNTQKDRS